MPAHFDVETYSEIDLRDVGAYRYAEDASTDCLVAVARLPKIAGGGFEEWRPGMKPPARFLRYVADGGRVRAHNVQFDAEIWAKILTPMYGWPWFGYDIFEDSMAMAQLTNLPGSLKLAASVVGDERKSDDGHKLMLKMCKPAPKRKKAQDPKRWHTPENMDALADYCRQDTLAEASFSSRIPALSEFEQKVFHATWKMNRRGVRIDVPLIQACMRVAQEAQTIYRAKLVEVTGGAVTRETYRAQLAEFMIDHGVKFPYTDKGNPTFNKQTAHLIDLDDADEYAHEAYDIYKTLNKSSIAKLDKMLACACHDLRIRGMTCYSGAGQTGRWAGRFVQLQNLYKGCIEGEDNYAAMRSLVMRGANVEQLEDCYGSAMEVVATLVRPCLIPEDGNVMVAADYSAIEGRVLAWLAGEQHVIDAYAAGKRMYAVAAAGIFGCPYDQVVEEKANGDSSKDRVGKIAELACGFGGSVGAFLRFGGRQMGLTTDRIKAIVNAWRDDHPKTTAMWKGVERAAIKAVQFPGTVTRWGPLSFGHNGKDLRIRLPSGRCLWYRNAHITERVWDDGGTTPQITYYGLDENGRLCWQDTYGGKLTENIVQATARELLAAATVEADAEGWPLIFTVHDELIAEVLRNTLTHEDLCDIMVRSRPEWAEGLPLGAAGWTGSFYRKD